MSPTMTMKWAELRRRALSLLPLVGPAIFAAAVAFGTARTLGSLLGTTATTLGYWRSMNEGALSLFYGHGPYHDPNSSGYLTVLYRPGMPAVAALLDHVHVWEGWTPTINIFATAGLVWLAALISYREAGVRSTSALVRAIGIGAMGVWLALSR